MPGTVLSNEQATSNNTKSLAFLEFICWHGKTKKSNEYNEKYIQHVKNKAIEKTAVQGKRN